MKAFNSFFLLINLLLLLFVKSYSKPCETGYYKTKGKCNKCSTECYDCLLSSSHCTLCYSGYYLKDSSCHKCINECDTCSLQYYFSLSYPHHNYYYSCDSCKSGYYLSGNQCLKCDLKCKTCSGSASSCTSCNDGFYLNSNNCNQCVEPCRNCKSSVKCSSCIDNYFLYNGKCYECNTNCKVPINNDNCKCQECIEGYYLSKFQCILNSSINNETCDDGYYLTSDNICEECIESCKTCSGNSSNCLSCEEGFILLSNNTCIENITNNENIIPYNPFNFYNISTMINSSEINFIIINDFILSEQNISIINDSNYVKVILDTNRITIYEQLKEGISAIDLGNWEKIKYFRRRRFNNYK